MTYVTEAPASTDPQKLSPVVLQTAHPDKVYGSSLLRVAEAFDFVLASDRVNDLADLFQTQDDLTVVGVCDEGGRAQGLVTRVHLFGLLGKPFGRDNTSFKLCNSRLRNHISP